MRNDKTEFMFKDRIEAGLQLASKLKKYKNDPGIVLAVPRGGIPVAYAVAKELGFPVEVILTKKIGHPMNKEYAIGAASLSDYFIIPHENVSEEYIHQEVKRIRIRLKEMYTKFMGDSQPEKIIIGVPVASKSAVKKLSNEVDEVVAVLIPPLLRLLHLIIFLQHF